MTKWGATTLFWYAVAVSLAGFVAHAGCSDVRAPLSQERFVAVLVDLHLVESRREIVGDMPPETRDSVLAVHRISSRTYEEAVRYYTRHPDDYLELYNAVIDSLSAELAEREESGQVRNVGP